MKIERIIEFNIHDEVHQRDILDNQNWRCFSNHNNAAVKKRSKAKMSNQIINFCFFRYYPILIYDKLQKLINAPFFFTEHFVQII